MEGAPLTPIPELPTTAEKQDKESETDKKKKKRLGESVFSRRESDETDRRAEKTEPKAEKLAETKKPSIAEIPSEEVEPASEAEAPTEEVSKQYEEPDIYQVTAESKRAAKANQEMPIEKTEQAAELADRMLLEEVAVDGDLNRATAKVAELLGADSEQLAEVLQAEGSKSENEAEEAATDLDSSQELQGDEEIILNTREVDEAETEPDDPAGDPAAGGIAPPPPVPPTAAGSGGDAGLPPNSPRASGPSSFQPFRPAAPTPNRQPQEYQPQYELYESSPAAMALFGGIIGYLWGRRRGRIKAEKKAAVVQKKLEKQVENIQWQLREKEDKIRRLAVEQVRRRGPAVVEALATVPALARSAERPTPERRRAPEANLLHSAKHEHLGHVVIAAEAAPLRRAAERPPVEATSPEQAVSIRRVETMNRAELLNLSEKIIIDGSSLRQIYETHLIGERGLRRLVAEHLRGGDLKKALRQEIVEREIDFERDPILRDHGASVAGATGGGTGGQATLNKLIEKAATTVGATPEEAAFYKARAAYEASQYEQQQKRRQLMDAALITIILLLAVMVTALLLAKR